MPLETWLAFTATLVAVVLVPGPAVPLVVSHGMSGDRLAGFLASLEIAGSGAGFLLLTAAGLSAVLLASATAFEGVRWCGVAYLAWSGAQMVLGARGAARTEVDGHNAFGYRLFVHAFVLQSGSPNAVALFAALLLSSSTLPAARRSNFSSSAPPPW
ncbi:MAG: LysE family transporter [Bacteroidota bacterium]